VQHKINVDCILIKFNLLHSVSLQSITIRNVTHYDSAPESRPLLTEHILYVTSTSNARWILLKCVIEIKNLNSFNQLTVLIYSKYCLKEKRLNFRYMIFFSQKMTIGAMIARHASYYNLLTWRNLLYYIVILWLCTMFVLVKLMFCSVLF